MQPHKSVTQATCQIKDTQIQLHRFNLPGFKPFKLCLIGGLAETHCQLERSVKSNL